ncbi:cytochrome c oxidase subunit 3 [Mucilaginibacter myungsuensis]|uniref:Cytochrome c oxidase subunit 3 n=2 Tax=Mucilaginibacter myungsuensis TaxID=649104 RepID=A0A929L773_9SPHI|nr:cytochrome c oxidase subunit 3 [Mucilaginibacter myungsuensis]
MAQIQHDTDRQNLGAKKFAMWIFIFCSFMLFAAFSSGFIVYSGGKGHGLNVALPKAFLYSTIIIALSSVTMFLASKAANAMDHAKQQLYTILTIVLGLGFLGMQVYGWYVMTYQMQVFLTDPNASRSFVYVITFMHLLHILGGIIFLLFALGGSIKRIPQVKNIYRMDMSAIFWHFLDIVWIYLYVFLLLNSN